MLKLDFDMTERNFGANLDLLGKEPCGQMRWMPEDILPAALVEPAI